MYVEIDGNEYHDVRSLSFAPDVDLTGNTLPSNDGSVFFQLKSKMTSYSHQRKERGIE